MNFGAAGLTVLAALCWGAAAQASDTPASPLQTPGGYLAAAGDCVVCHSMPGAPAYAGGYRLASPLGSIYGANITPDPNRGIGDYKLADFDRALRAGVAKDGRRLYPAMPYPSYAKLSDGDVRSLYDYFMHVVAPVHQADEAPRISWPFNQRWPLALWTSLFVDQKTYAPVPSRDADWNRGAYLVQGLGHCGACHTPRGLAFQEKALDQTGAAWLGGAELDHWSAPNLRGDSNTGLGRWSEDDVVAFLRDGQNRFGAAFGTMTDVVNYSTRLMNEADLKAIAKYLKSLPPKALETSLWSYDSRTADALAKGQFGRTGAATYVRQCASCHGTDGRGARRDMPPLAGNPAALDPSPASLANVVLNGSARIDAQGSASTNRMPEYRTLLSDQEIADVLTFVRTAWGNAAASVSATQIAPIRAATESTSDLVILHMR